MPATAPSTETESTPPAEANAPSFIEAQFPVSKVSKERYKERKANHSQTLTGLGKWWGRKPLVMVRAALIGLLMPASDDPKKDRKVFLKIMTMDEEGMLARKKGNIKYKEAFALLGEEEQERFFDTEAIAGGKMHHHAIKDAVSDSKKATKREIQRRAFSRLSYDEKLGHVFRPEEIEGPTDEAWDEINAHLGTDASSLPELVRALGERRFGHPPRVGDAFCGGGSVPFEAARLGFDAYGADLNPVAALLTWASLNIVGGGEETAERVREAQERVYRAVDEQITDWGIEHRTEGPPPGSDAEDPETGEVLGEQVGHWRADAYLYCVEADCPECGTTVPLAPSWVIGKRTNTVARLTPDRDAGSVDIEIAQGVSQDEIAEADAAGTVQGNDLVCPACEQVTPMRAIRGDRRGSNGDARYGLRRWENEDVAPREDDTFGERLYCVRWVQTYEYETANGETRTSTVRCYDTVTDADREREAKAQRLLDERFDEWQEKGYIPSRRIEEGAETARLQRERGWTHWHHLFNPRQLLTMGWLPDTF
ncbi:MAG: hypothetical protein BRD37_01380 [Bacteroidetes bacterium QH_8_67_23]|nr:MAG: hypothetical protein BRD37_01380 [Bacteroidetes bacterium QH_8_67_23]